MTLLTKDRIGALLVLAFCSAYWFFTYDIRLLPFQQAAAFHARTMPEALSVLGVVLCLAILVFPGSDEKLDLRGFKWGLGAVMLGLMVFYGLTLRSLGFIPSTTLFLIGGYMALGERKALTLLLASLPVVVAFWALMTHGLDIYVAPWPEFLRESAGS
ncbi:MAG: tripartite tricarboxylate transporter TctB family protein [Pseudomonadota bacterium]